MGHHQITVDVNGVGDNEANDPCRSDGGTNKEQVLDHLDALLELRFKRTSRSICKDHLNENCVLSSSCRPFSNRSRGEELMSSPQPQCIGVTNGCASVLLVISGRIQLKLVFFFFLINIF